MTNKNIAPFTLTIICAWGQVFTFRRSSLGKLMKYALEMETAHRIVEKGETVIWERDGLTNTNLLPSRCRVGRV